MTKQSLLNEKTVGPQSAFVAALSSEFVPIYLLFVR
jgi:hypothetical protein